MKVLIPIALLVIVPYAAGCVAIKTFELWFEDNDEDGKL